MDFCHQQCGRQVPRGSGHLETKTAPTPQCWAPNAQWPWVRRTLAQSLHGPPVSAWPRSGCPCSPRAEIEVGGVSRDPDRMEGPSFSVGCPLGKATRGRAHCPCSLPSGRVFRSRAGPRAPRLAPREHWSSRGALYPPGLPSLPEGLLCQGAPVRREKACVSQGPKPATRRSPAKQLTK